MSWEEASKCGLGIGRNASLTGFLAPSQPLVQPPKKIIMSPMELFSTPTYRECSELAYRNH